MEEKKLFLIDAMALIYRAYFAFIQRPLINSKGMNTSAIRGFVSTLHDILENEKPTHIAVAFDTHAPTEREAAFADYKANREETPEDIIESVPYIKEITRAFNIPVLEKDGYEADDIIGTIARKAEKDGFTVYMVTPDKDFGQLVTENIFIYKPLIRNGGYETMGIPEVLARWDIKDVSQVIDILGLMGDKVDNIPGVPGVGEKTAVKLMKEFGSLENLLENTDKLKGKLKERIEEHREQAILSKQLATIITDVPVDYNVKALRVSEPDREKLAELFSELEFRTLGRRILGEDFKIELGRPAGSQMTLFGAEDAGLSARSTVRESLPAGTRTLENTPHEYHLADTREARQALLRVLEQAGSFSLDTETTGLDPMRAELVGLSFCVEPGEAWYVPCPENPEATRALLQEFVPVLEDPAIGKTGQNLKYDLLVLKCHGVEIRGPMFDTLIAHFLLEPERKHNMDYLAEAYLNYRPVSIESLIGKRGVHQGSMRQVPVDVIKEYAAEDADITLQLRQKFEPLLKEHDFEKLYYEVEIPLMGVLVDMEYAGVALDAEFLNRYSAELQQEIIRLTREIHEAAGVSFNIDSPKQLSEVLFRKLEIPYEGRKTRTGQFSTNEEVLTRLASKYPIARLVLEYRELTKLKSTYVDALPGLVNPKTGRVHTHYSQTVAVTGRLSSSNPNLQNIPIRTDKGREIRKAFIPADEQHVIISADYSQIELRIIASLSGDENMIRSFRQGLDIHAATASQVFDVPLEEVTPEMRRRAKMVNFGIAYGISAYGLGQRLGIPREEAAGIIKAYFEKYPGIRQYMDRSIAQAKEKGYVTTLLGRRRYLPDINAKNATVRGFAERNAINTPIQGTAADIIKVAMIRLQEEIRKRGLRSVMTMQVHDELVFDAVKEETEELVPLIRESMEKAVELKVPLVADVGRGANWLAAH